MRRARQTCVYVGLLVVLSGLGCRQSSSSEPDGPVEPPWFAEVTQEVGLDFVHDVRARPLEEYFMPQSVGSGAALFDCDGDGRLERLPAEQRRSARQA